jgi:hypothetical protein
MSGTAYFYGLVYLANQQGVSTSILNVTGNATIQGVTAIDGNGGATLGASKTNLIYDARAAGVLQGSTGAAINRNSFRLLPNYIA